MYTGAALPAPTTSPGEPMTTDQCVPPPAQAAPLPKVSANVARAAALQGKNFGAMLYLAFFCTGSLAGVYDIRVRPNCAHKAPPAAAGLRLAAVTL